MQNHVRLETAETANSFESKVFDLLDRTEYRRVTTPEEFHDIGRLRFKAFDAKKIYPGRYKDVMLDEYDSDPFAMTFAILVDEKLVSSVRLQLVTPEHRVTPAIKWFPEVLNSLLDQGYRYIDPNRLAVDLQAAQELPGLPHVTLRLAVMATRHFSADACLSCVKKEHAAFYRRTFRATAIAGPIKSPDVAVSPVLFSSPRSGFDDITTRYPFYSYLEREAELLFGDPANGEPRPLTVLPTARWALQQKWAAA